MYFGIQCLLNTLWEICNIFFLCRGKAKVCNIFFLCRGGSENLMLVYFNWTFQNTNSVKAATDAVVL